ncbi:hypothetical protein TVAG_438850 [Trichomonas vaginalis G3]|uniref:Uncharacterized protein n=1 Tax=Trichomonas vaginalis (strain ATCC PRA-98 / G3) TaxID=412133 RepID=A2FZ85_TRIV3|nr:hypothetical protein TVAGG3_1040580 [Trichomonas vaginalis G3]EAX89774.1 hypothetical protein TVAG_438850 [Trichomonas vaginalis G3]KAI5493507.1 hypothetical protein TVAGG3_1040580 [Trichomonas vaginalis G3]|eukprot:XP_001302704.1 hypothetical protein [Trichomonas vaginalis G3]
MDSSNIQIRVNELLRFITKNPNENLAPSYIELTQFAKELPEYILTNLAQTMLGSLADQRTTSVLYTPILELMYQTLMFNHKGVQFLFDLPSVLKILFPFCKYPKTKAVDILLMLFLHDPQRFCDFIANPPHSIVILREATSIQKSRRAGELLLRIFCLNTTLMQNLIPEIRPSLRELTAHCAIGMMLSSAEMQQNIPEEEFADWFLSKSPVTHYDVKSATLLYPAFWLNPVVLRFLCHAEAPEKLEYVEWLSAQPKQPFLDVDKTVVSTVCNQLTKPPTFTNEDGVDLSKEGFIFFRYFILSHTSPDKVIPEVINMIMNDAKSKNEFLAAAALQVLTIWAIKYNFEPKPFVVMNVATTSLDEEIPNNFRRICAISTIAFSQTSKIARSLVMSGEIKAEPTDMRTIARTKWRFPNFHEILEKVMRIKVVQLDNLVAALGQFTLALNKDF